MDQKAIEYQRAILSGLIIEEYIEEENNKKLSLIEEILNNKTFLFSPIQINILKKALNEIKLVREEGCCECWIMSEAFIDDLNEIEKSEFIEIIATGALVVNMIPAYLKILQKEFYLRRVI